MTIKPEDKARALPTLFSLSISETIAYYQDKLGFQCERIGNDYLIAKRGEMELHFQLTSDKALPNSVSAYIRGGEVQGLFSEFSRLNINISDFLVRPWNMQEFHIIDCHGNLLRFGCCPL